MNISSKIDYKFPIFLLVLFLLSFFLATHFIDFNSLFSFKKSNEFTTLYDIRSDTTKKEILLVYLGCSTCGFSNDQDLIIDLRKIGNHIIDKSEENNSSYSIIGLSREKNINEGIDHLLKYNIFTEINTGNNWHSLGIQKFIWEKNFGTLSTPQILIISREYKYDKENLNIKSTIENSKLLVRLKGLFEIANFANSISKFEF